MRRPRRGLSKVAKGLIAGGVTIALVGGGGAVLAVTDPLGWRAPDTPTAAMVPANTILYAEINLKPDTGQQLEMLRFALKFPSVRKNFSLTERSDPRAELFRTWAKNENCRSVSWETDIEPWLGERAAVFIRKEQFSNDPNSSGAADGPMMAVTLRDEARARSGIAKLEDCGLLISGGQAYGPGYVVVGGRTGGSHRAIADTQQGTLADNPEFRSDVAQLGTSGIVTSWLDTRDFISRLDSSEITNQGFLMTGSLIGTALPPLTGIWQDETTAATLRFTNGNPEIVVAGRAKSPLIERSATRMGDLPGDATLAVGISDSHLYPASVDSSMRYLGVEYLLESTPLTSQDVRTILGQDILFSADLLDSRSTSNGWDRGPFGFVLRTDQSQLAGIAQTLANEGLTLQQQNVGDLSYVAPARSNYLTKLQNPSTRLADNPLFKASVVDAGRAHAIGYANLGAYADSVREPDLQVLGALGYSRRNDGKDYTRTVIRLTTR